MVYYCYVIVNAVNGKKYVGFAVNPKQRWREHKWYAANGTGYAIHEAIRKHGVENFTFEVICCGKDKLEMLRDVEPLLIRQHQSHVTEHGYNLKKELSGVNWNSAYGIRDGRFRPRSDETKALISQKVTLAMASPEARKRLSDSIKSFYANGGVAYMTGRTHSEESKRKMSETTTAMVTDVERDRCRQMSNAVWNDPESRQKVLERVRNMSQETRAKMSAAKVGKPTWNKGGCHAPESIEKMRSAHTGKVFSDDTCAKMSDSAKKSWTTERRKQQSDQRTGTKHLTKESKAKIGNATRKYYFEVTTPAGDLLTVESLTTYCAENGINEFTARVASKTGRKIKTGYRFVQCQRSGTL
jgi:group I intron endonuclease